MKKLLTLLFTAALAFSLAMPVFAQDAGTQEAPKPEKTITGSQKAPKTEKKTKVAKTAKTKKAKTAKKTKGAEKTTSAPQQ